MITAFTPLSETLLAATPLIFTGLAVALGFQCGLFNIGAEGQLFVGAAAATFVGISVTGMPWFIHLPLTIAAGFLGGAAWGFIPGFLKARTGAHEVIVTIMLNYTAYRLIDFILKLPGYQREGRSDPISRSRLRRPGTHRSSTGSGRTGASSSASSRPSPYRGSCTGPRRASSSGPSDSTRPAPGTPG